MTALRSRERRHMCLGGDFNVIKVCVFLFHSADDRLKEQREASYVSRW